MDFEVGMTAGREWRRGADALSSSAFRPMLAVVFLAAPLGAQTRVQLELRPAVGDTIRMRIEQDTEVQGQKSNSTGTTPRSVTMSLRLWSRAIVQGRDPGSTAVLTVTDSVRMSTSDPHAQNIAARTEQMLAGRTMRLRVAPDGTARVTGGETDGELSAVVSAMPAALPSKPVSVGERWRREMPVPGANPLGAEEGIIRAVFQLDSVTRRGALAWISVKGELSREPVPAFGGHASTVEMRGTLNGTLVLDRRRGWLTDARFMINVQTTVAPPRTTGLAPMLVLTKIVQRMRVEP
jgi:hypothetical protein